MQSVSGHQVRNYIHKYFSYMKHRAKVSQVIKISKNKKRNHCYIYHIITFSSHPSSKSVHSRSDSEKGSSYVAGCCIIHHTQVAGKETIKERAHVF